MLKENLERKKDKSKCLFCELREMPSDWDGDIGIMHRSQESRQGDISKNIPNISEEWAIERKTPRYLWEMAQIWEIGSWFWNGNLRHRMAKKRNETKF